MSCSARRTQPAAKRSLPGRSWSRHYNVRISTLSAASQRGNVGYAYLELGAWALAVEALRGALTEATSLRAHSVAGLVRHNLGFALARGRGWTRGGQSGHSRTARKSEPTARMADFRQRDVENLTTGSASEDLHASTVLMVGMVCGVDLA